MLQEACILLLYNYLLLLLTIDFNKKASIFLKVFFCYFYK